MSGSSFFVKFPIPLTLQVNKFKNYVLDVIFLLTKLEYNILSTSLPNVCFVFFIYEKHVLTCLMSQYIIIQLWQNYDGVCIPTNLMVDDSHSLYLTTLTSNDKHSMHEHGMVRHIYQIPVHDAEEDPTPMDSVGPLPPLKSRRTSLESHPPFYLKESHPSNKDRQRSRSWVRLKRSLSYICVW